MNALDKILILMLPVKQQQRLDLFLFLERYRHKLNWTIKDLSAVQLKKLDIPLQMFALIRVPAMSWFQLMNNLQILHKQSMKTNPSRMLELAIKELCLAMQPMRPKNYSPIHICLLTNSPADLPKYARVDYVHIFVQMVKPKLLSNTNAMVTTSSHSEFTLSLSPPSTLQISPKKIFEKTSKNTL